MYKDEMIQMHQFLVYVLKYLAEDDQIKNDCSEYITLKISPAIFVLCKIISEIIAKREDNPIPENVRNSLSDLVRRSEAELHAK